MPVTITQDDICQLTRSIWESTLNLEVRPLTGPVFPRQRGRCFTGAVAICGAWNGEVLLECSEELMRIVARIMFAPDSGEPTHDDTRDAMGEISNITAGNFKSLLGGRCHVSLPRITDRTNERDELAPQNCEIASQAFECQGESFVVTLIANPDNHEGAVPKTTTVPTGS